ncbi:hypothetical protein ACTQ54_10910 [Fundicoccus sp. Sow4_H7]|uniref:hypothetical protein n=1 Tax=Fundicoccus sp. Sow4_H7 TaxID=3438784 RepID=UPI003F90F084
MKFKWSLLMLLIGIVFLTACEDKTTTTTSTNSDGDFAITEYSGPTLSIVVGSENEELEPILESFARENKKISPWIT